MPPGPKKRKAQRRKKQQQQQHHPHHPSAITPSSPSDSDSQQNPIPPPPPSQGNGGSLHDPIAAHGTSAQRPNTTDGSSADDADAEKEPAAPTVETSVSGKGEERVDVQGPEISAAAEEKGSVVRDVVLTPPPYSELVVSKPEEEGTAAAPAPAPVDAKEIKDGEMESVPELVLRPSQVVVSNSKDNNSENKAVETSDVSVPIVQCDSVNEEVKQMAEDAALSSEVVGEVKAVESALESVAVDEVKNVVLEESVTEKPRGVEVPEKEMVFPESASEKPRETAIVGEVKEVILAKSAAEQPRGVRVSETTVVGETKEVVLADSATKQPHEIELSETTEVIRAPLIQHRATWWNCCGLLDVLKGSQG